LHEAVWPNEKFADVGISFQNTAVGKNLEKGVKGFPQQYNREWQL
jgi:hypothetical protein